MHKVICIITLQWFIHINFAIKLLLVLLVSPMQVSFPNFSPAICDRWMFGKVKLCCLLGVSGVYVFDIKLKFIIVGNIHAHLSAEYDLSTLH